MATATASSETVVATQSFQQSLFAKVQMQVTNKRFMGESQNLFLGLIPTGKNTVTYPLANISSVASTTNVKVGALLFGIVLFFAFFTFKAWGIIVGLIGLAMAFNAFQTAVAVTNNAGQKTALPILFTERQKALEFVNQVNNVLAEHM